MSLIPGFKCSVSCRLLEEVKLNSQPLIFSRDASVACFHLRGAAQTEDILRRFTRSNVQHPVYRALSERGAGAESVGSRPLILVRT